MSRFQVSPNPFRACSSSDSRGHQIAPTDEVTELGPLLVFRHHRFFRDLANESQQTLAAAHAYGLKVFCFVSPLECVVSLFYASKRGSKTVALFLGRLRPFVLRMLTLLQTDVEIERVINRRVLILPVKVLRGPNDSPPLIGTTHIPNVVPAVVRKDFGIHLFRVHGLFLRTAFQLPVPNDVTPLVFQAMHVRLPPCSVAPDLSVLHGPARTPTLLLLVVVRVLIASSLVVVMSMRERPLLDTQPKQSPFSVLLKNPRRRCSEAYCSEVRKPLGGYITCEFASSVLRAEDAIVVDGDAAV